MLRVQWTILSAAILFGCGKIPGAQEIPSWRRDVNQQDVGSCVENGVDGAFHDGRGSATEVAISISELSALCSEKGFDPENTETKFGVLRKMLPKILERIVPSREVEYGGWDRVLAANALALLPAGKISEKIDPQARSLVIFQLSESLELASKIVRMHPNLSGEVETISQMAMEWSLRGSSLSLEEVRRIVSAIANTIDLFPASTREMIGQLTDDPRANLDLVDFADSINFDYREKSKKAKALAIAVGASDWLEQVYDRILQIRLTEAELDSAIAEFEKSQP